MIAEKTHIMIAEADSAMKIEGQRQSWWGNFLEGRLLRDQNMEISYFFLPKSHVNE